MEIKKIVEEVAEAVKVRDSFNCDSQEYEKANEKVDELIGQVKSEDLKYFNEEINKPEAWE